MDAGRRNFLTLAEPLSPSREAFRKRHLPDILVETHEGKTVRFYEDLVRDRVVTLNCMYLKCEDGRCPITTHNLARAQKQLKSRVGHDIFMYSLTLDPERDTIAALRKFARGHRVGPGWLFLRASPQDTEVLRRSLGFTNRDPELDAKKSAHAAMVRFGNEPRQLWSTVSGYAAPRTIARAVLGVAFKAAPSVA